MGPRALHAITSDGRFESGVRPFTCLAASTAWAIFADTVPTAMTGVNSTRPAAASENTKAKKIALPAGADCTSAMYLAMGLVGVRTGAPAVRDGLPSRPLA